jgi:atypical dual specificity phosphatase
MNAIGRAAIHATFYPTLGVNRLMCGLRLWRPWDPIDERFLLGSAPRRRDIPRLAALNVRAVVNLCAEFAGWPRLLAEYGISQLRLPTLDYHCPSETHLAIGVRFALEATGAGRVVYAHCKAGRGRSATLAVCYLMAQRGVDAAEAEGLVRAVRAQIDRGIHARRPVRALQERVARGEFAASADDAREG